MIRKQNHPARTYDSRKLSKHGLTLFAALSAAFLVPQVSFGHGDNIEPHDEYLALSEDASLRCTAYHQLFDTEDDPDFLDAIRDATNGGFALVGEALKSRLSPQIQQRLARRHPGPGAVPLGEQQGDLLEQLGLRPRTS